MTMIAGFRVQDGILLCSDTEWSGGTVKLYDSKIFTHPFQGGLVSFAVAGNEGNAKMVIQDCQDALVFGRSRPYTPKELKRILREAVRSIQEKYVENKSGEEKDKADFQLIISLRLKSEGMLLLSSIGPAV